MKPHFIILLLLFSSMACNTIKEDQNLLINLLQREAALQPILENPDKYEVQLIYTQINRDSANNPSFKSFNYNVDNTQYFYPASTVKFPIAVLALEKLNELAVPGLSKHTTMLTDSAFSGQTSVLEDSTSESGSPNVAHYIKKLFVVSDNDAYNRLYEFLGQEHINAKLHAKGYSSSAISHRLSIALSQEENRHTNPIRFVYNDTTVYKQPLVKSSWEKPVEQPILKGKAFVDNNDSLINAPFDFTYKNKISLADLHLMLRNLMFPPNQLAFNLKKDDYQFLYQYMSQLPSETKFPNYVSENHPDGYCKFLMFANEQVIPKNIRIFNKIGQAYGYLIDNAYIVDFDNKIEFLVSAVISVNENETYNDGVYEYDSIGYPFMKAVGQTIYNYEKVRTRQHLPDLSRFKITYDQ